MVQSKGKEILNDLVEFLKGQGHSEERAAQIAGNHPDAVRADMESAKPAKSEPAQTRAEARAEAAEERREERREEAAEEAREEAREEAQAHDKRRRA